MEVSRWIDASDVQLALYEWGTAEGRPTIVLVHGYPDAASIWQATAEGLARDFHVVAYDVRGAGQSTRPEATAAYALETLVEDLAAVIDTVSPHRPIHLVGHDWGSIQSWEAVTTA
ncbi:MAG: alpha/beta fold hydrolase, partial [Algiphilus sp.]